MLIRLTVCHFGCVLLVMPRVTTNDPAKQLFRFKNIAFLQSDKGCFAPLRRRNKSSMRRLAKADEQ